MNRLIQRAAVPLAVSGIFLSGCGEAPAHEAETVEQLESVLEPVAIDLASKAIQLAAEGEAGIKVFDDPDEPGRAIISDLFSENSDQNRIWVELQRVDGVLDATTVKEVTVELGECHKVSDDKSECTWGSQSSIYAPGTELDGIYLKGAVRQEWVGLESSFTNYEAMGIDGPSTGGYEIDTVDTYAKDEITNEPTGPVRTAKVILTELIEDFDLAVQLEY
ncbi:MAG: hypothetical protein JWP13_344 [Candidatus Saccharibacteria bacterium]|nr:hypothetical protein [Candidatus Saccharibacteria bacterium]